MSAISEALDSWSATIIKTTEGGIICPNVPEAVIIPVANVLLYLAFSIEGKDIRPMAITVAPTMPVVAANNPPTKTTEIPNPPGILPNN